jgi:prepilin-type N-terminal cleavage/methylation domain-containing protein
MRGRSDISVGRGQRGMSMIELVVVCAIMAVVMVIAIPQLAGARRNTRAAAGPAEVKAQLRYARQMAMARQRAVTFQYLTNDRQINVILHDGAGINVLNAAGYPLTAGNSILRTLSLVTGGLTADEIAYGLPPSVTNAPLDDTTTFTPAVNNQVNVTFQPDGSVVNAAGGTANFALVFYHPDYPETTTRAVSVLGASGRIKVWRFTEDDDGGTFVE